MFICLHLWLNFDHPFDADNLNIILRLTMLPDMILLRNIQRKVVALYRRRNDAE
ncbi:hypothetical protein [Aerosakkonema funiforme]|uniref:hypothetical protein n=1 Tax=Aerosakkonema funiforme TaxID=1246630 RepID=UPI001682F6E3|nr:hypothetical protein [Aerosakkonema funiforme]